ncbi:MAG TPA: hypothetical protein VGW35_25530 [Methylomirabilota bacterium]|jgi:DNA-directed RNA polymerase subunit RPC12/RpoP|nr:hypothetical protein [Methylomirabilota bacterium]
MRELQGKSDGGHFRLICADCGVETKNEYLQDYQFIAACPSCGKQASLKFDPLRWQGLPATPAV